MVYFIGGIILKQSEKTKRTKEKIMAAAMNLEQKAMMRHRSIRCALKIRFQKV
jgi:hypothetical protein